jgi:hypothetical protein
MPVALAALRNELLPGLFDVRGSYDMIPRQWDKIYKTRKSNMAVERSTQMAFLGLPFFKTEGAATQFDNEAGERWAWNIEALEVALGYSMPIHVDEPVATVFGDVRLGDIEIGDMVLTRRGRYRRVEAVHKQGVIPIVQITTRSGRVVNAAPCHPFLTVAGWKDAGDLTSADAIAVGRDGVDYDDPYRPVQRADVEADIQVLERTAEWDAVLSVKDWGVGECRCLTVTEDSSFVVRGLVVHNTRKAIDDNLYKQQFNPTNLKMQEVFAQFKEIQAASVLNTATVQIPGLGGDGVPLASTAHPVDGASFANRFSVDISLNESSLLQGMVNVRTGFVNERNVKILARARQLIIPPALEPVAIRLLRSELRPGTADNDTNAILSTAGGLPEGFIALDFLTSSFGWFLKTNIEGLIHILRIPFEQDLWVDNVTDNLLCKGYERYVFAYNDPRCLYCSFPTS